MPKNYAIMRCQKIKTMTDLKLALAHNRRERVPLNAKPDIALESRLDEICDRGVGDFKVYDQKMRKNAVKAVEWLFTASDLESAFGGTDVKHLEKWVRENINFVKDKMGGSQNILSCTIHYDETSPHMHIITVPEFEGKLNCKHYLGGNKWVMRDLQDNYFERVKQFGFDRGEPKKRKYNDHIKSDIKALENKLVELQEEVKKNELEIKNLDLKYNQYQNSLSIKVETKKENEKEKILSADDIKNKVMQENEIDKLFNRLINMYDKRKMSFAKDEFLKEWNERLRYLPDRNKKIRLNNEYWKYNEPLEETQVNTEKIDNTLKL